MHPEPSYLPYWMQLFAFIASAILAFLSIIGIVIQLLKEPALKFRLTRELFLRLSDSFAESFFANGVLVSENAGIFIDNISFILNKKNTPTKSFSLRCAFFGEKVRGLSPISDFNWYSTSPLTFIPVFYPHRGSYLLVQQAYEESIKRAFSAYRADIIEELKKFRDMPPALEPERKAELSNELLNKAMAILREHMIKIMELVQIEAGEYELEAEVFYRIKKFLFVKKQKSTKSKIAFKIEANIKDIIRADLFLMLQTMSLNMISGENKPIKSPEYSPIEVREM